VYGHSCISNCNDERVARSLGGFSGVKCNAADFNRTITRRFEGIGTVPDKEIQRNLNRLNTVQIAQLSISTATGAKTF
jgi:hypothetical protein